MSEDEVVYMEIENGHPTERAGAEAVGEGVQARKIVEVGIVAVNIVTAIEAAWTCSGIAEKLEHEDVAAVDAAGGVDVGGVDVAVV